MPRADGYWPVVAYYVVISVIAAGVDLFWSMLLPPNPLLPFADVLAPADGISGVVGFLMTPLLALVILFSGAGIAHVMLLILRGANHGYETTTRAIGFTHGPALFVVVPYAGMLVGSFWTLVLAVIALREAHETTTGKALAALLLPFFFIVLLGLFLALLIGMAGLLTTRI